MGQRFRLRRRRLGRMAFSGLADEFLAVVPLLFLMGAASSLAGVRAVKPRGRCILGRPRAAVPMLVRATSALLVASLFPGALLRRVCQGQTRLAGPGGDTP